jgi:DNA-binding helix-hairpin-helix protein with protein kinase domain
MTSTLINHLGQPVTLGQKLGFGGEGAVYDVVGSPQIVAKVYHKPLESRKAAKLQAMVGLAAQESMKAVMSFAAWPTATLHQTRGSPIAGILLRKLKDYSEIHTLYSPAHRKTTFPDADWKFLVHTAANCAAAFHALHERSLVIADVNEKNVFVSREGFVALIDCDSFQVQAASQTFLCSVGVPLFTPPELHGKPFRSIQRTPNHDLFGLAVLIFHLLFMGRHPFAGRFSGQGEMPLERSILESRFAYGRDAPRRQMQPPLHSLPLETLSPQLVANFARAFAPGSPAVGSRPSAAEWHGALKTFTTLLRRCPRDGGHVVPSHWPSCPWCDLVKQGAPNFFVSVSLGRMSGAAAFVLTTVWARIDGIPRPANSYSRPAILLGVRPSPWPQSLPAVLPGEPETPAILTRPPKPPPPQLPPQRFQWAVLPPSKNQRAAFGAVLISLMALIPCVGLGAVLGELSVGSSLPVAVARGLMPMGVGTILGVGWSWMELQRRMQQEELNKDYRAEQAERRRQAAAQRKAWLEELANRQLEAVRIHRATHERWKAITSASREEGARRRQKAREAWSIVEQLERQWSSSANQFLTEFDRKKAALLQAREQHVRLTNAHASEYQQLLGRVKEIQLTAYLDRFFIRDAKIPGVGEARTALLVSNGIETALDVEHDKVRSVPGFGEKLTKQLLEWRASKAATFVFNAALGLPKSEEQMLAVKYYQMRQPIEGALSDGEKELNQILQKFQARLQQVKKDVETSLARYAQATADTSVIPKGA